ncbi:MAG: hypothetical protein ACKOX3_01655 [Bacteroidota bacterium]
MNKVSVILSILFSISFVACSVSEEEKAAELQRHRDSVSAAEAMIRAAQQANETRSNALNGINQEAMKLDSLIKKDSVLKVAMDTTVVMHIDSNPIKKNTEPKTKTTVKSSDKTEQKSMGKKTNAVKASDKKKEKTTEKSKPKKNTQKK